VRGIATRRAHPIWNSVADRAGPDEVDSALDRLLLGTALSQLSEEHRAVVRRSYYQGWTTAQIANDSSDRGGHGEIPTSLTPFGRCGSIFRKWG